MTRVLVMATAALAALTASFANAQYPFYGGTQASTVGQSYAMGMADLVRAAGDNNLRNSEAAINYEQARSQNLDNRLKGTQTYVEMRRINEDFTRQQRGRGLSTEEAWRVAQIGVPKRLSANELDPVSGRIYWPMRLQDPRFAEYRTQLDELFRERELAHGSIGYEKYVQIEQVTDALLGALKKNLPDFSGSDYIRMRNFVDSLAYEAKFPAV